ncbi:MAG: hypothetical protein QGG42_18825 [Phycisphaerae bacterium]|jgi:hypothetical protein|nr:hypothetical protein [Phycisphaerae bacterium]
MLKRIPYVILLLAFAGCSSESKEAESIRKAFQAYRTALLAGDGHASWSVVDSGTHEYYNKIAKLMSSSGGDDTGRLDLISRLMIMRMRLNFSNAELAKMDGRAIFTVGVTRGWISKANVQRMERLTKVEVTGDLGKGYVKGVSNASAFPFVKESDGWKVSLSKLLKPANEVLKSMARRSRMSEREFLRALLDQAG